jgi:VIT1/CCC1 family predicted Fe2+/Mn2+ transporter
MAAMSEDFEGRRSPRILDPIDRYSEVLFGLFMVLTFTGTLSVATAGRDDVRTMLIAAIGCNTAWGFVDAVMYVLRNLVARGRKAALLRQVQSGASPQQARQLIVGELGPLASGMDDEGLERMRRWLLAQPPPAPRPKVTRADLLGALGVFLLVFGSTFPVVLPFIFMSDLRSAMRVSGAVAIVMLFVCGQAWGRYAGSAAWRTGIAMVITGAIIQAVVIALGG